MKTSRQRFALLLLLGCLLLGVPQAQASTSTGMPWEGPIALLALSINGPVAFGIGLIGITVAGGMLIWGGEISQFAKSGVMLACVIALLVGATPLMASLFGVSSALVP